MHLYDEFEQLVATLQAARVPFAVCGGIAVALHGHVRATDDIDLLMPLVEIERAKAAIKTIGFRLPAEPMTFGRGTARQCTVQRVDKIQGEDHLIVDLRVVEPSYVDVWESRVELSWKQRPLPVVSRSGLARMKRLAGRHQDLADLENLGINSDE